MEEAPANLALAIFVGLVAAALWYCWRFLARLRDALEGQDGYRLLVIVSRLFFVVALTSTIGVFRWLSLVVAPDADWFRQIIALVNISLILGVHVWALMGIRGIIASGGMHHE